MNSRMRIGVAALAAALFTAGQLSAQEPVSGGADTLRPYTVAPLLQNSAEIGGMLESQYPPDLRNRGVTGTVMLLVMVDTQGGVRRATVWESSGHEAFDEVAESLASKMRFVPAQGPSGPIAVQIMVPVDFKLKQDVPAAPELVSYDVKPELVNAYEANRVLDLMYPQRLRESKIGGRMVLWVFVGADGYVERTRVMESSGYDEFDRAAGLAARVMEFRPALADGEPVGVWNPVTVAFIPNGGSSIAP